MEYPLWTWKFSMVPEQQIGSRKIEKGVEWVGRLDPVVEKGTEKQLKLNVIMEKYKRADKGLGPKNLQKSTN